MDPNSNETRSPPINLDTAGCPIDSVTVFRDRAEITRLVNVEAQGGVQEIVIKGLPKTVKPESIHVSGASGDATILEVSYSVVYDYTIKNEKHSQFTKQIEELERKQTELTNSERRLKSEQDLLKSYANSIVSPSTASKEPPNIANLVSDSTLQGFANFLKFNSSHSERIDHEILEIKKKSKENSEQITKVRNELSVLSAANEDNQFRQVVIAIHTDKKCKVSLGLIYIVTGAGWEPSYDVRVLTAKKAEQENSAQLTYYGSIQQNTGENWTNVRMLLSTAAPASSTEIPKLETRTLTFYQPPVYSYDRRERRGSMIMMEKSKSDRKEKKEEKEELERVADTSIADYSDSESSDDEDAPIGGEAKKKPKSPKHLTSTAKRSAIAATFEIPRRATIDSDNKPHKVTIALITMKPTLEYYSAPRKVPKAYLRASMLNNSPYALILGPANIFLDNDFVASSELKMATGSSAIECSLGVDNGISIVYDQPKTFSENKAAWLKKKTREVTIEQKITVVNTKMIDVVVRVVDQLPYSKEESIKVKLLEPTELTKGNVKLNDKNNLEWTLDIKGQNKQTVSFKYSVEWPSDKNLDGLDVDA